MKTKIFYNNGIAKKLPLGFTTIMLFGMILTASSEEEFSETSKNHETIHVNQWTEITIASTILILILTILGSTGFLTVLLAPFIYYILYVMEWGYQCILVGIEKLFPSLRNGKPELKAYKCITFEQEAYHNSSNLEYNNTRKLFAWTNYINSRINY